MLTKTVQRATEAVGNCGNARRNERFNGHEEVQCALSTSWVESDYFVII